MELRFGVLAGALIGALVVGALHDAAAAPVTPDAKAAFADGVARYQKADWDGAAAAFGKSYGLEADNESLFAWAQAERKRNHCDRALELYEKLLAQPALPAANAAVIRKNRDECQVIVAHDAPKPVESPPPPPTQAEPPPLVEPPPPPPKHVVPPPPPPPQDARAWWKNPVGDALVITGVVALGAGVALYAIGRSEDRAKTSAVTYGEFQTDEARATRDGRIGEVALIGGGLLVGAGVVWLVTHAHTTHATPYVDRTAGVAGFSFGGSF